MAPRHLQPYGNLEWNNMELKNFRDEDDDLKAIKEEYCRLLE
jgi:hypothetical protein